MTAQAVSTTKSPMISSLPSTLPRKPVSESTMFHTVLYYYAGGPGRGGEINDNKTWSVFWNSGLGFDCCGWVNSSVPQIDFKARTVLIVSSGMGHIGEKFNLTRVIMSHDRLDLKVVVTIPPLGPGGTGLCSYPEVVAYPVLIVDIPKTDLPATLDWAVVQGTSC